MSRNLDTDFEAALVQDKLRLCMFFEGSFPSGDLRLWTGQRSITWGGRTWVGAGSLLGISDVEESSEIVAAGVTVKLSGIPLELVSMVIAEVQQNDPCSIYLGLLGEDGALVSDPMLMFAGRLDVPELLDSETECSISISYENRAIDMNRPVPFKLSDESQRILYSGDTGLRYAAGLQSGAAKFWGPK